MSKKDTSYSDAMNQWAAKQSFLRNRRNRILHPDPSLPPALQFLGYSFRAAVVAFLLWIILVKVSGKLYNGTAFNDEIKAEVKTILKADEFEAATFSWMGKKSVCKKITATGSEEAFYRQLEATSLAFELPLHKRLRPAWNIEDLRIEKLSVNLKSGGKSQGSPSAMLAPPMNVIAAGLLPKPDHQQLSIQRISCGSADLTWGLSQATLGAIEGTEFELFSGSSDWRMQLEGGTIRQNWLHDLIVEKLTVRRNGSRLLIGDSSVKLGNAAREGTLEGEVTLERLPSFNLELKLPEAQSRDLIPNHLEIPEYFYGNFDLDLNITGSINTLKGIETSGKATLITGTFTKIPALEAIDKLLKTSHFRLFSPDDGEVEFTTGEGQLRVSKFECRSKISRSILRGEFTYTPAVTNRQADAANASNFGKVRLRAAPDNITGKLQLGIRSSMLSENQLARSYFKTESDGYHWIEIPLDGPLDKATKDLHAEITAALRE